MNGDTLEVMKAISDFRQESAEAISKLHQEFASFKGGMDVRVTAIEADQEKAEKRQWIHSILVSAGAILHHDLGQWFHWKL